jgi:hypothetical protein
MSLHFRRPLFRSLLVLAPVLAAACAGISSETESDFQPGATPAGDDTGTLGNDAEPAKDSGTSVDAVAFDSGTAQETGVVVVDSGTKPDTNPPPPDAPVGPPTNDTCSSPTTLPTPSSTVQIVTGDSTDANDDYTGYACNNGDGKDVVYKFQHPGGDFYVDSLGSTFDTVLSVETACDATSITKACSDSTSTGVGTSRTIYRGLDVGSYLLFVDGQNTGDGGPFRLAYSANSAPIALACDSAIVISDVDAMGTPRPIGMDIYDRFVTGQTSKSQVRGTTAGGACRSVAGQQVVGRGMEQVYRLNLTRSRRVTVAIDPMSPTSFNANTFDVVAYIRDGGTAPVNNCTQYQGTTTLAPDRCVTPGTAMTLPAGTYFLFLDSVMTNTNPQQQPQGRIRAHVQVE